jgi:hypothetical protein
MASMSTYHERSDIRVSPFYPETPETYEKQRQKQIKMEREYKVVKLNELAVSMKLPSNKGHKTNEYLEIVIEAIESKGYRFVQFLQLIDVLYVIIDTAGYKSVNHVIQPLEKFRPEEEIHDHYFPPTKKTSKKSEEPESEVTVKFEEALDAVKSRDHLNKNMSGAKLPWKK